MTYKKPQLCGFCYNIPFTSVKNPVISYTKLRQVLICLMKEYGCTVSPLLLIIESMENHGEITDIKELAGKVAEDMGPGYRFENWMR